MVLGCNIIQALRTAVEGDQYISIMEAEDLTYYFSTHGCRFWVSFGGAALDDEAPLVAAAAARALLSKKVAIALD